MDYRRESLTILTVVLVIWYAAYFLSYYTPLGFLAMLFIYYPFFVITPWLLLVLSVLMLFANRKWFSLERLFSLLLLIPFLLTIAIPFITEKINLYKVPTDSAIRAHLRTITESLSEDLF